MGNGIYRRPLWSCMKKVFGCTWKKHNRTAQVSTSLSVAAMLPHPSMNDTPSHFDQNAVLPHPVHFFHVLIFHFRKQIISWRMYGVIAEGFDHSLDHLDTWKPFAFSHTNKCLLATDSLRHLVTRCYPIRFPTVRMASVIVKNQPICYKLKTEIYHKTYFDWINVKEVYN